MLTMFCVKIKAFHTLLYHNILHIKVMFYVNQIYVWACVEKQAYQSHTSTNYSREFVPLQGLGAQEKVLLALSSMYCDITVIYITF